MKERLRMIRTAADMSQQRFAEKLGVSVSNIQSYELGRRSPSDAFINLICEKCHVNEKWLRTGEGEMNKPLEREEEVARLADQMLSEVEPSIRNAIIRLASRASEEELEVLVKYAYGLIAEIEAKEKSSSPEESKEL